MSMDVLNTARKALTDSLGEKTKMYFDNMKLWFKMKITKEEFDVTARMLLTSDQVHLHNEFFIALLNKVDGLAEVTSYHEKSSNTRPSYKRHKHSSKNSSDKSSFEDVEIADFLPQGSPLGAESDSPPTMRYASQEYFLPDHALITGRFMLTAWEQGLECANDDTANLIVDAVQQFLKNILTAVISKRKGYKVRDSSFIHDIGSDVPNMFLKNTDNLDKTIEDRLFELDDNGDLIPECPLSNDEAEHQTARNIACCISESSARKNRVSMQEVYDTLKIHRNLIPSHTIYSINMERIATLLH